MPHLYNRNRQPSIQPYTSPALCPQTEALMKYSTGLSGSIEEQIALGLRSSIVADRKRITVISLALGLGDLPLPLIHGMSFCHVKLGGVFAVVGSATQLLASQNLLVRFHL